MRTRLAFFLPYLLFLAASFAPFLLYGSHVINSPYLNDQFYSMTKYFETWTHANKGGFTYYFTPFDIIIFFTVKLFSQSIAMEFSDAIIVFLAFITSYTLMKFLFKNTTISIIASFVYSYSIYGQFMSNWTIASGSVIYALAPLYVYIFLSIDEKKNAVKQALILGLWSILFIDVNVTFVIYLFAFLGAITIFRFFTESKEIGKKLIVCMVILIICYIGVNSVFFVTFFGEHVNQSSLLTNSLAAESVNWKSSTSYLHELLREMGALDFYYIFLNMPTYPNAQIYQNNPIIIVISYIFAILPFISILVNRKNLKLAKWMIFYLVCLIISLFIGMGVFPLSPTRIIYEFLTQHIPYFSIFRDTYKIMFLINLIYTVLIGYLLVWFTKHYKRYVKVVSISLVICIMVNSYQLWTGNFLQQEFISIPGYWYAFSSYYGSLHTNDSILFMPTIPYPVYTFTQQRGKPTMFFRPLVNDNQINNIDIVSTFNNDALSYIYTQYNSKDFSSLLGFYDIPYVLLQHDVDWRAYHAKNPNTIKQMIDKDLSLIKTFQ